MQDERATLKLPETKRPYGTSYMFAHNVLRIAELIVGTLTCSARRGTALSH